MPAAAPSVQLLFLLLPLNHALQLGWTALAAAAAAAAEVLVLLCWRLGQAGSEATSPQGC
jgi:uncharacterized membrane protein YtjA (UPF0391 family)